MRLVINGEEIDGVSAGTVSGLLVEQAVRRAAYVSVELNGEILDRDALDATELHEGDRVEFLYFMGGGQWN